MVDSENYKEKVRNFLIEELLAQEDQEDHQEDHSGTYLFFSFDLVNSTLFKNNQDNWIDVFQFFYDQCLSQVKSIFLDDATLWKMTGDEVLFYILVNSYDELYQSPKKIFQIMENLISYLHENYPKTRSFLSVKSTLWAALVHNIDTQNEVQNKRNFAINTTIMNFGIPGLDFLGLDIDIGFRISKFASQGKLVVDAKLACLLKRYRTRDTGRHKGETQNFRVYENCIL